MGDGGGDLYRGLDPSNASCSQHARPVKHGYTRERAIKAHAAETEKTAFPRSHNAAHAAVKRAGQR